MYINKSEKKELYISLEKIKTPACLRAYIYIVMEPWKVNLAGRTSDVRRLTTRGTVIIVVVERDSYTFVYLMTTYSFYLFQAL